MQSELVVLGGGPGGYTAAFLAADLGIETTLVEQRQRLGGVCLLEGCIPSKALLHVAKLIGHARDLKEWGVVFQPPRIDLDSLRNRNEKALAALTDGLGQLAAKRKVKLVQARAVFENSTSIRLEGLNGQAQDRLTFEKAILATGSAATRPGPLRLESRRMMTSTEALALPDIPRSLLVVGGGYIGLELGSVYARLGSEVTVVEMTDSLLPGVDSDLVRPLHKRLEGLFKRIHVNTQVASAEEVDNAVQVRLQGDAEEGPHRFDRVLVATGRRPNSGGIGLENTAVELDEHGFARTDSRQQTADEHVFAVGDVAGQPMLAHKAFRQARVAVGVIRGRPDEFDVRAIPAIVYTDPEIAWAGLTELAAKDRGIRYKAATFPWIASGRAHAVGRTEGLTKVLADPQTQQVLGVGIVGFAAGEMIAEAALAVEMACTLRDVAGTIHPHPTMSESIAIAAEMHLGEATEVYRPPGK